MTQDLGGGRREAPATRPFHHAVKDFPMTMMLPPLRVRAAALLLLVVSVALGLSGALARQAAAADARWSVAPADNRFGADREDYGFTLGPGGRIRDAVVVVNQGDAPLRLALRPADAVATASGRFGLVDRGARAGSVSSWVHLERDVVTVVPGAAVTVPFTITPPKDAAAGDHVGGIVTAPAGSDVDRGVQIRLRVSGPLKPALAVDDVRMRYAGTASPLDKGDATVTYVVRNTGNAILSARQAVSASGLLGIGSAKAGRIVDTPPLLPGSTWKVTVPVRDVAPALRLKATVKLTPLLADAAGSIAPLPAREGTGHAWAVPWALVLLVAAMGGFAAVALRRGRGRRRVAPAVA